MSTYAAGKKAYGISDRSGFRYRLHRMKKEWTGMLVGYDEWEAKQPQLEPLGNVIDPQALKDPRPDKTETLDVYAGVPVIEGPTFKEVKAFGQVGQVTVTV
ncbi:MAG: hypothetical protein CMC15_14315 [Flavobacteriaceae bacterium]|jgi:hypothetical protein|nr:hypothetical protein [Flavobacteriaceae bacterium]|tara:strand:- start:489 stop:791 length:303 start_codon:yes stop_codon:yes gene_type:complete